MPNPKAPRVYRQASESVTPLDQFLGRLERLGADAEQLTTVRERWDDFDDQWTPEARSALLAVPDAQLRAMLRQVEQEYVDGTTVPAEDEPDAGNNLTEARDRIGQSVPALLQWVADDPARAQAVVLAEMEAAAEEGRPQRRTLLQPLAAIGDVHADTP
jgi:hypothetical protein